MADLASELQRLAEACTDRSAALHDDYVHTRMLWGELLVQVRRHGRKIVVQNPLTKTVLTNGTELAAKARSSMRRLRERSFKDLVAQFELFVAELLRLWLATNTSIVSEKALNVGTLLASKSLAEAQAAALREAIDSFIADKMYGRPEKWFSFLKRNVGVRFADVDESSFIEMKARRDVLEHHNGMAEAIYQEKAKASARYKAGEHIHLTGADVDEAYQLVQRLIQLVGAAAIAQSVKSATT